VKYTFHIVDVFSSTPFGGNQLAVLPDATGISTEGMQKIAREFNFGETTFVLPKKDLANTYRVRIFSPRAELDFAGHPSVGTACALVMKQHVRLSDPVRLTLEENVGPVTVDVAQRNAGFHGTLTLSGKIETPTGAPSPADLAAVLSIEPAEVSQVFFAGVGVPFCFAQLSSNETVDRATINSRRRGDLCQRWRRNNLYRKRRDRGAAVCACVVSHCATGPANRYVAETRG
jgi:trans-2,3-dihydro-3-hydroxyanthranilate isomerase